MIIGVTGKSGVGKSTYARKIASESCFCVVHIDNIAHGVIKSPTIKAKLIDVFGCEAFKDGEANRKYIGELIFTNRHLYKETSDLIWGIMKQRIDDIISAYPNVVLDWVLLPHTHYWNMCDKKILVVADEEERKRRVMDRDNISAEYLSKRDSAGISYDDIVFDQIIDTSCTRKEKYDGKIT